MPFSKSVMGRGFTTPLGFKVQPTEKTLAESIERMQKAERKKLTFDEWYEQASAQFDFSGTYTDTFRAVWDAAQENME